jgi:hypothetical protein
MKIRQIISTSPDGQRAEVIAQADDGQLVTRHVQRREGRWHWASEMVKKEITKTSPLEEVSEAKEES